MTATTSFQAGDLVLALMPFTAGTGAKRRAALVILDTGDDDVMLARVTTQAPTTGFDVPLVEWQAAGLIKPSVVRLHKLATIDKSLVGRQVGRLTPADRQAVAAVLHQTFANW